MDEIIQKRRISFMRRIFEGCHALELPIITSITAMTLMHRYLEFIGFEEMLEKETISIATIIFLSCKVDENTRTLREVLSVVRKLTNSLKSDWVEEDKIIKTLKKEVIVHEQYILRAIQFKTNVDVPHKYLLNFARTLSLDSPTVTIAWGLLNDSYLYPQVLLYEPPVLCCGCIYIAIECRVKGSSHHLSSSSSSSPFHSHPEQQKVYPERWWTLFNVQNEIFWNCLNFLVNTQQDFAPPPPLSSSSSSPHNENCNEGTSRNK